MRILVAIDDSQQSDHVVQAVARLFRPEGTQVRIVQVLPALILCTDPQRSCGNAAAVKSPAEKARALLDKHARLLRAWGFQARALVERGGVAESIVDLAATWHADLILLGAGHRRVGSRFPLGMIAESVLGRAPCAVMIIREGSSIASEPSCTDKPAVGVS